MTRFRALALAAAFACISCGSTGSSAGPTSPASPGGTATNDINIAGTWNGTATDTTGPGTMTWVVTQTGSSFTGTVTLVDTATSAKGKGTVSGTVSGSAVRFTVTIPAGGFDAPYASCAATTTGDAVVIGSTMTATYSGSGSGSCGGTIAGGQFTLTKS